MIRKAKVAISGQAQKMLVFDLNTKAVDKVHHALMVTVPVSQLQGSRVTATASVGNCPGTSKISALRISPTVGCGWQ